MQFCSRVIGQAANLGTNGICCGLIVLGCSQVCQPLALSIGDHRYALFIESDVLLNRVILQQLVKVPVALQQLQNRVLSALFGGYQSNLIGNPALVADKRIQGFCDDLRRHAADSEEDFVAFS